MASNFFRARFWRKYFVLCVVVVLILITIKIVLFYQNKNLQRREDTTYINVIKWLDNPTVLCQKYMIAYANEFVHFRYARLNKKKRTFLIPCEEKLPEYPFLHGDEGSPLIAWYRNLSMFPYAQVKEAKPFGVPTFVIMRIEAHNLYHTLCEWYNVFLLSKLLGFNPSKSDIVFLDDRPNSLLDTTWDTLFGSVHRYTDVPADIIYKDLIWNMIGYESPVNFHSIKVLPFIDEFYHFFTNSFGIPAVKPLDCVRLSVTVIWRRDYMTHPERQNMTGGLVHRKFYNEKEIEQEVNFLFRNGHRVQYVVLENMTMLEQVKLFTSTDILVGMHGAGMSHVMFLPPHAGVLELFPNYWGFPRHFKAMARWRKLHYIGWHNTDPNNEYPAFYTRIPATVISSKLEILKNRLCL